MNRWREMTELYYKMESKVLQRDLSRETNCKEYCSSLTATGDIKKTPRLNDGVKRNLARIRHTIEHDQDVRQTDNSCSLVNSELAILNLHWKKETETGERVKTQRSTVRSRCLSLDKNSFISSRSKILNGVTVNLPSSPSTLCPFKTLTGTISGFCIKSLEWMDKFLLTCKGTSHFYRHWR